MYERERAPAPLIPCPPEAPCCPPYVQVPDTVPAMWTALAASPADGHGGKDMFEDDRDREGVDQQEPQQEEEESRGTTQEREREREHEGEGREPRGEVAEREGEQEGGREVAERGAEEEPSTDLVERARNEPDVLLHVPVVKVDEINLEVENLQARVSLQTEVLQLLKLNVGADVVLGRVQLTIKGVEAQALLKVRLGNVTRMVERVLATIDHNPEILTTITRGVGGAVQEVGGGAGRAVEEVGGGAGRAVEDVGGGARKAVEDVGGGAKQAVGEVGQGAGGAVKGIGEGAGGAVQGVAQGAGEQAGKAAEGLAGTAQGALGGQGRQQEQQQPQQQERQEQPQPQQPRQQQEQQPSGDQGKAGGPEEADDRSTGQLAAAVGRKGFKKLKRATDSVLRRMAKGT